jgi:hypothetical protein
MNDALGRNWKEATATYFTVNLEELRKIATKLSKDSRPLDVGTESQLFQKTYLSVPFNCSIKNKKRKRSKKLFHFYAEYEVTCAVRKQYDRYGYEMHKNTQSTIKM